MRALGGPLAPNLLLVPAALSSVGWIITILSLTGVLGLGAVAASVA